MSEAIEAHLTETRTVAPPAEFAAHIQREIDKYAKIIRLSGARPDA